MKVEHRILQSALKDVDSDGAGGFSGYASIKGEVDSYGDIIEAGAYKKLDELVKRGWIAEGHDWNRVGIGYITKAVEDERGLYIEARFHDTPRAQEVRKVVAERKEAGKDVGLSIGFYATEWEKGEKDGADVRIVKGLEVVETSIVTLPAAANALLQEVRDGSGCPLDDHAKAVLDAAVRLVDRIEDVAELRGKMTEKNRERLEELSGAIDELGFRIAEVLTPETPAPSVLADLEAAYRSIAS